MGFDDYDLRLGDVMRGERATIGKSLLDVQRELRIKAAYIAAIENCDVAAFETPGFIAGYVRSYAKYLGMDPEWAYRRFCEEADFSVEHGLSAAMGQRPQRAPEPAAAKPRLRDPIGNPSTPFLPKPTPWYSRIEPGAIGSLTVLIGLSGALLIGFLAVLEEVQRVQLAPVDQAPGVLADLDPVAGIEPPAAGLDDPVQLAAPGMTAPAGGDSTLRTYRPPALDVPVLVARDGPISAIDPSQPRRTGALQQASQDNAGQQGNATEGQQAADAGPITQTPVQVVQPGPPVVEVLAVRPSWVRVQAADGTVLFEKILDAGERYEVPQTEAPARLRAGNSGSVYFIVNGETLGPSAPGANIARNVDLSADALREAFPVADMSADADLARMIDVADVGAD